MSNTAYIQKSIKNNTIKVGQFLRLSLKQEKLGWVRMNTRPPKWRGCFCISSSQEVFHALLLWRFDFFNGKKINLKYLHFFRCVQLLNDTWFWHLLNGMDALWKNDKMDCSAFWKWNWIFNFLKWKSFEKKKSEYNWDLNSGSISGYMTQGVDWSIDLFSFSLGQVVK